MIMGDTTLHNPAVNWRKISTHAPYKEITWSISGKVIGSEAKYPRSVLKIKGEIAAVSVSSSALAFITTVSKFFVKCVV